MKKKTKKAAVTETVPISGQSLTTTAAIKTGTWRNVTPFFTDRTAPCVNACLAGEDIPIQVELVYENRYQEALEVLRLANPFPAITGRVCPAPCEKSCLRGHFGGNVSVKEIERFLGDFGIRNEVYCTTKNKRKEKVAIIGAGPAGLSAAYFLGMLGYRVIVFNDKQEPGGMLRYGIPSFRLPRDILKSEIEIVFKKLSVEFVNGLKITSESSSGTVTVPLLAEFHAVVVATGKSMSLIPSIKGVDSSMSGLHFLERVNSGNPPSYSGSVIVIGGGSTAFDCARTAIRLGCRASIHYRRSKNEMPAFEHDIIEALEEGVEIIENVVPLRIEKKQAYEITFARTLSQGRSSEVKVLEETDFVEEANHVLFATGETQEAVLSNVQKNGAAIEVGDELQTYVTGIFAAGDVLRKAPGTVSGAILQGRIAANSVHKFLSKSGGNGQRMISHARGALPDVVALEDLNKNFIESDAGISPPRLFALRRIASFEEVNTGFDEEQIRNESKRCLSCGTCVFCENCMNYCPDGAISHDRKNSRLVVNTDYCKGCMVCIAECPRSCMGYKEV